jgi:hypothetical protein
VYLKPESSGVIVGDILQVDVMLKGDTNYTQVQAEVL